MRGGGERAEKRRPPLRSRGERIAVALGMCLVMAGCGSRAAEFAFYPEQPAEGTSVPVFTVTSRAKEDEDPGRPYAGGRSLSLSYSEIDVWVPEDRDPGSIRLPKANPDPKSEFGITKNESLSSPGAMLSALNRQLRMLSPKDRTVVVFVHGYNVSYVSGVYRHAQILHDFGRNAVGLHYSWPSAAKTNAYLYDRDSVQFARDGLVQTLEIAARSNARSVAVVAHSMGTLLTMEALRQLSLTGKAFVLGKIDPLVLAAPDIDERVFESQVAAINPLPEPFIILASQRDKALKLSRDLRGGTPRVGQGNNIDKLQQLGITVIDLSAIKDGQDGASHATFANSPTLITLVQSGAISPDSLPETREALSERVGGAVADMFYLVE